MSDRQELAQPPEAGARLYKVKVTSGNPDLGSDDIDASIRRAVAWLSDEIDPDGNHSLYIEVHDGDDLLVTAHEYDPPTAEGPQAAHDLGAALNKHLSDLGDAFLDLKGSHDG